MRAAASWPPPLQNVMRVPRAIRWRIVHCRARWLLLWSVRIRPSQMQKEFNAGDPHGNVRKLADEIIAEMKQDGKWNLMDEIPYSIWVPRTWANDIPLTQEDLLNIMLLRSVGCRCELPLLGQRPYGKLYLPRCRICNAEVIALCQ
jgi:hypothetical protein